MGLTGIISELKLQLIPVESAYVQVKHEAAPNLEQVLQILQDPSKDDKYSVAWLDGCSGAGRGIVMTGHHAAANELPATIKNPLKMPPKKTFRVPFQMPSWFLNNWDAMLFNKLYFAIQSRKGSPFYVDLEGYFYPLDAI